MKTVTVPPPHAASASRLEERPGDEPADVRKVFTYLERPDAFFARPQR